MPEIGITEVRDFLDTCQGKIVDLDYLRRELGLAPGGKSWNNLRKQMERLVQEKVVSRSGRKDGTYKVVTQVKPVNVFGVQRQRRPPFPLIFPKDWDTGMEMAFAEDIVIREGDVVNISGVSNYGKTTLALNFCGENIDHLPVLMGNEYTTPDLEPTPRFLNRLDSMDWVEWVNGTGEDKFTLLPVREDYAEHIVKDRINIIDWINMDAGELYDISRVMDGIKKELRSGIAIIVLQKGEGANAGRGGQFTKDFTDCELLIDMFGENEVLLKIGKVKESTRQVVGRHFAYGISQGVKIINFREVTLCGHCRGQGYTKQGKCDSCLGKKYVNR